jgi:uncharacterized YigZ family protein
MESDEYLTIEKPAEGLYKEKGSKFMAFALPAESEQEVKNHLDNLRKHYHDARHHCYAYRLGTDMKDYRMNDDGEPSSTAGKPIFGQIQSYNLTNILIVVVRYFGGTLLGTSGLVRAYKSAAENALQNATVIKKTIQSFYEIHFGYDLMNEVEKLLHEMNVRPYQKNFTDTCTFRIAIRINHEQKMAEHLKSIHGLKYKKLYNP